MTKEQRLRNDYKAVFGVKSPSAQRVMADLAKRCWYNDVLFDPASPMMTSFREGQRAVFLDIKRISEMDDADLERAMDAAKKQEIE